MQLFGDLVDILSFVRVSRLKWIGHVYGMDCKSVIQAFNSNPQGSRLSGRPQNRW
jgi:hypothetical protein